ncbi:uncharacterized protein HMPREF1541_09363 [Cyphellophora europaea CBS 101466]|uniref:DUF4267 domain-containing protein n=1 Tax=Cyphellophora europaea (strain CBS 101466) TaxID=1220924 RepID=W2S9X9_CYPE1|nr:uncharacterized protein HMPREF1541_09363 [Cyphellophora europaea CBS 101466]ETN45531.1 hypothetical protein HMPREF1541_09363 [Cyphellophora europaea CBS 101466]
MSVADPQGLAKTMGFKASPEKGPNLFTYAFGIRELSLAAALLALIAYNEWRAVAILLACIGINGTGDFLLVGLKGEGWLPAFKTHGIPTLIGSWAVWQICQELIENKDATVIGARV